VESESWICEIVDRSDALEDRHRGPEDVNSRFTIPL